MDAWTASESVVAMVFRKLVGALLFAAAATTHALALRQRQDRHSPGIWSWACGYASYQGAQPAGFRVEECFEQVLHKPPPWLRGWFHVIYWDKLEPEQGVFDWTEFDNQCRLAAALTVAGCAAAALAACSLSESSERSSPSSPSSPSSSESEESSSGSTGTTAVQRRDRGRRCAAHG